MAPTRTPGRARPEHTLTLGVDERGGRERSLLLRVVDGPDVGRSVPLADASVIVGAGTTADLALTDPGVSRRHLELALVDSGVRVVDLKSKNGTLLQGARLSSAVIDVGAELVLGKTTLRIEDADELLDVVESPTLGTLTTRATSMRRCFGLLERAAGSDVPITLQGEPGVGKGLIARAVHERSGRSGRPFVEVDLSAVADDEVIDALLGPRGAFEQAQMGTLLLDDVDGLPLPVQSAVARAIDTGELPRGRRMQARVLAAVTRDLDGEVRAGRVRADLRDAIGVVRATLPPLRERFVDLPDLCQAILRELGRDDVLDRETVQRLQGHRWPGNVRELRHVLMRAVATAAGGPLQVTIEAPSMSPSLKQSREQSERDTLVELLQRHGGNVSAAARAAEVDRRHLHRLLKRHGLRGS